MATEAWWAAPAPPDILGHSSQAQPTPPHFPRERGYFLTLAGRTEVNLRQSRWAKSLDLTVLGSNWRGNRCELSHMNSAATNCSLLVASGGGALGPAKAPPGPPQGLTSKSQCYILHQLVGHGFTERSSANTATAAWSWRWRCGWGNGGSHRPPALASHQQNPTARPSPPHLGLPHPPRII